MAKNSRPSFRKAGQGKSPTGATEGKGCASTRNQRTSGDHLPDDRRGSGYRRNRPRAAAFAAAVRSAPNASRAVIGHITHIGHRAIGHVADGPMTGLSVPAPRPLLPADLPCQTATATVRLPLHAAPIECLAHLGEARPEQRQLLSRRVLCGQSPYLRQVVQVVSGECFPVARATSRCPVPGGIRSDGIPAGRLGETTGFATAAGAEIARTSRRSALSLARVRQPTSPGRRGQGWDGSRMRSSAPGRP